MMITRKKRLLYLVLWMAFLSLVYWGLGDTELTMPITYTYFGLCLLLSLCYILVCGGIAPILDQDREREEKTRERYLQDKGKMHPIKRRDKYRRFRILSPEEKKEKKVEVEPISKPNPLKIPEHLRPLISQILLLAVIPFYLIFLLDWIYLAFFL